MRPPTYKGYHEQQESKRQGSPTGLFDINHTVWYLIERKPGWTVATAIMLNVGCGISNRNREHGEVQRFYNFVDFCVLVYIIIYNRQVSMITRVDSQLLRLKHPLHLLSNTLPQKASADFFLLLAKAKCISRKQLQRVPNSVMQCSLCLMYLFPSSSAG